VPEELMALPVVTRGVGATEEEARAVAEAALDVALLGAEWAPGVAERAGGAFAARHGVPPVAVVLGAERAGTGEGHASVTVWLALEETHLQVLFSLLPMFTPQLPEGRQPDPSTHDPDGSPGFWESVDQLRRDWVARLGNQRRCALLGRRCEIAAEERHTLEGGLAALVRGVRLRETRSQAGRPASEAGGIEVQFVDDPSQGWGRPIPRLALVVMSSDSPTTSPSPDDDGGGPGAVTIHTDAEGRAALPRSRSGVTSISVDWRDALGPLAAHLRDARPLVLGEPR
jgi:hypothetical protein